MIRNFFTKYTFTQIKGSIESLLKEKLNPTKLSIIDESSGHSRGKQTHFNAYIVSSKFQNLSKLQRHKLVYSSLGDIMGRFHALTLTCRTISEQQNLEKNQSPGCVHKKK